MSGLPLAIVQSASGTFFMNSNTNTNVNVTLPSAPTQGNLLLSFATFGNSIAIPTGWTQLDVNANNLDDSVNYKIVGASESATQVAAVDDAGAGHYTVDDTAVMYEIANANATTPINAHAMVDTATSTATTTVFTVSITTTVANCWVMMVLGYDDYTNTSGPVSVSSGWNKDYEVYHQTVGATYTSKTITASKIVGAPGTYSCTFTLAASPANNQTIPNMTTSAVAIAPGAAQVFTRALADAMTLADSLGRSTITARSVTDSLSIADTVARTSSFGRTFADGITVADTIARTTALGRSVADTIAVLDTVARTVRNLRGPSDSMVFADSIFTGGVHHLTTTLSDSMTVLDGLTRQLSQARTATDVVTITDAFVRVSQAQRALADSLSIADTFGRTFIRLVSLADALTITDSIAAQRLAKLIAVGLADTMTINDTLIRVTLVLRIPTDSMTILDTAYRSTIASRSVLDSMSVADTVARNQRLARALVDAMTITDAVSRDAQLVRVSFADFLTIFDTIATTTGNFRASYSLVNMVVDVQDETPSQVHTRQTTTSVDDQKPGPNIKPTTYGQ